MGLFPILTSNKKKTVYTNGRPPWYSIQTGLKTEKVYVSQVQQPTQPLTENDLMSHKDRNT